MILISGPFIHRYKNNTKASESHKSVICNHGKCQYVTTEIITTTSTGIICDVLVFREVSSLLLYLVGRTR